MRIKLCLLLLVQTLASPTTYRMLQLLNKARKQELLFKHHLTTGEFLLNPVKPQVEFAPDLSSAKSISTLSVILNNRILQHYCRTENTIKLFSEKLYNGDFVKFEAKDFKPNTVEYVKLDLSILAPVIDSVFIDKTKSSEVQQLLYFNSVIFLTSGGRNFRDGFEPFADDSKLLQWFYQSHRALLVFFLEAMPYYNGKLNFFSGYTASTMTGHIEESKEKIMDICRSHKHDRKLLASGFTLILNLDRIKSQELSSTCEYFKELIPFLLDEIK